jgi:hypothetical protein
LPAESASGLEATGFFSAAAVVRLGSCVETIAAATSKAKDKGTLVRMSTVVPGFMEGCEYHLMINGP